MGELISFKNKSASFQEKNVSLYKRKLHEENLFTIYYFIDFEQFIKSSTDQAVQSPHGGFLQCGEFVRYHQ